MTAHHFVPLATLASPAAITAMREVLGKAGIPYDLALKASATPEVVVLVPEAFLNAAQGLVRKLDETDEEREPEEDGEEEPAETESESAGPFPWAALRAAAGLILLNLAIVVGWVGRHPTTARFVDIGGLVPERLFTEPWRLLTSLLIHSDVRHVAWNGVTILVFAIPAIMRWGYARAAVVYLATGIAGGLVAAGASSAPSVLIGSSGAAAGLFGAWAASTFVRARRHPLSRRATIRTLGVALLVLPSLLNPTTADGRSISVAAHVGGLVSGLVIGFLLSRPREESNPTRATSPSEELPH